MRIEFDPTGTIEGLQRGLEQMTEDAAVNGVLVLAADGNDFAPATVDPLLHGFEKPVFGGVFPEILHGRNKHTRGTVLVGLTERPNITLVRALSDTATDFDAALSAVDCEPSEGTTTFFLVDGFSRRIEALLEATFHAFGLEGNYIGGGAGSLSMVQKPCLFTNDGLLEDAAIMAHVAKPSGIGVSHGWESVNGPFRVSESDRNVIHKLDGRPALDVYREVVEGATGETIGTENFFDLAKRFPFGIQRYGAEMVVRDPLQMTEDGALVCVGEVPQESVVFVLTGDESRLITAAGNALERAQAAYGSPADSSAVVFFDCISRVLFLGDRFDREIESVIQGEVPHFGALTIGEIANSGNEYLEFYNKTSVVGVLTNA